jgi:hypothetical protein
MRVVDDHRRRTVDIERHVPDHADDLAVQSANGNPLAGATVKFVPEKFLSDYLTETPTGTTSENGMAMISLPTTPGPDGDPPGMGPGMYRVEITKAGDNIPAQYNTNTTLGQEVSLDNPDMQMGIRFNLKY